MPPKRKPKPNGDPATSGPEPAPSAATPLPERVPEAEAVLTDKISFTVRDGKIDLENMRKNTRDRFQAAIESSLKDPEFRKLMGMGAEPEEAQVTPEVARMILDAYAGGEAMIYANRLKIEVGKAHEFARWGEIEGEMLARSGARIANKYIPLYWRQRLDLFFFAAMLFSFSAKKFQKAAAYAHSVHPVPISQEQRPEPPPQTEQQPVEAVS